MEAAKCTLTKTTGWPAAVRVVAEAVNGDVHVHQREILHAVGHATDEPAIFGASGDVLQQNVIHASNFVAAVAWLRRDCKPFAVAPPPRRHITSLNAYVAKGHVMDIASPAVLHCYTRVGVPDGDILKEDIRHLRVGVTAKLKGMRLAAHCAVRDIQVAQRTEPHAGLRTNAVISHIDICVGDSNIGGRVRIHAIVVGAAGPGQRIGDLM